MGSPSTNPWLTIWVEPMVRPKNRPLRRYWELRRQELASNLTSRNASAEEDERAERYPARSRIGSTYEPMTAN